MGTYVRVTTIALVLALTLVLAVPGQPSSQAEAGEGYERVLVQFKPGRAPAGRGVQGMGIPNAQVHHEFPELDMVAMTLPASQVAALRNDSDVLAVQPDAPRYPTGDYIPYGVAQVEGPDLWDPNGDGQPDPGAPDGSGRLVCLIDSGVDTSHVDFTGVDFVGGYPANKWYLDGCGHGTHVAGTIAAMSNNTGVVGVSPGKVSMYVVRVFGDNCGWAYVSDLVSAALKCRDAGADIINMSLGGDIGGGVEEMIFGQLYNDYGILSVAAAGNNGSTDPFYPASYDSVIAVAAVDQNNVVAGFSQKHDQVELAGPGVRVYSTYKDGGYAEMSGTSMAAPHVTAAAALVWSGDPSKTNVEIRQALQETALDLGPAGWDNSYGYGLVQAKAAYEALDGGSPTAVTVTRFEARGRAGAVHLEWETASELDLQGFYLYRAESQDGPQVLINEHLIPGQAPGSVVGALYSYSDDNVPVGTYYYWLETVDVEGQRSRLASASATVEAEARHRLFLPLVRQANR